MASAFTAVLLTAVPLSRLWADEPHVIARESIAIGGGVGSNNTITNTVYEENPATLAMLAKAFSDRDAHEALQREAEAKSKEWALKWKFTTAAVAEFFKIVGEQNVPDERVPAKLVEIATHFAQTREVLAALAPEDAQTSLLAKQAREAFDAGRLAEADALLARANELETASLDEARNMLRKEQEVVDRRTLRLMDMEVTQGNIALTQVRYGEAAGHFGRAASLSPPIDTENVAALRSRQAQALYSEGSEHASSPALRASIETWRIVLAIETRGRAPDKWAAAQNNLGTALLRLGEREGDTANLEEAVAAYRGVQEELTFRSKAQRAATQSNLGNALAALGGRERGTARLNQAVVAYRAALIDEGELSGFASELERIENAAARAATQNNLGIVLWTLGKRENATARLEQAVATYREALDGLSRERVPIQWASTQNNLGLALWSLGERESGTAHLKDAEAAYRLALEESARDRVPLQWAAVQNNLGLVLWTLGERGGGTVQLDMAVTAFRASLEERTPDKVPLDWGITQHNLGNALRALGDLDPGTERLEEAVAAFHAALTELTRERVSMDWAATESDLGSALRSLGERESGTTKLNEAVAAFRAALEERTRDRAPLDWAYSEHGLANALAELAEREKSAALMTEAIKCMRGAVEVYRQAGVSYWLPLAQNRITVMEAELPGL